MAKQLSAHEYPLRKIFSSDYEFRIPDYQRPYRWGTNEALQLQDDLEEALGRDDTEPYFLGSLVLVEESDTKFDVIDGQQRLTTLSILFAVLRDLSSSSKIRDELGSLVLEPGVELDGIAAQPRLTVRKQDKDFFERYVQRDGGITGKDGGLGLIGLSDALADTETRRAMRDNAKALHQRLAELDEDQRKALATLMRTRTFMVVVTTPNLDSAYRIFSVMNARGLDLSPTDIFKSQVVGLLPPGSDHAKTWEDTEEALGSDAFTDLFRDIRTITSGERGRLELLREFPDQVLNRYLKANLPAEFIQELLTPYGQAFEQTITPDFGPGKDWEAVSTWLRRLAMIDNKDWRPLALWALKEHPNDAEFLTQFLTKLERLAAMFLLRGTYTTPRIQRYLDVLQDVKDGAGLTTPTFELSEEEKRAAREALTGEVYQMQPRRARYVLLRLDEILAGDAGVTYKHDIISIEHVLPQNPQPDSQWCTEFSEDQRAYWTHRLGNLLLLNRRKNSQAGNYDFARKKEAYFRTSSGSAVFALTTQVLKHVVWTPETVSERQEQLVETLTSAWDLG